LSAGISPVSTRSILRKTASFAHRYWVLMNTSSPAKGLCHHLCRPEEPQSI
jgi:hypothetical protein